MSRSTRRRGDAISPNPKKSDAKKTLRFFPASNRIKIAANSWCRSARRRRPRARVDPSDRAGEVASVGNRFGGVNAPGTGGVAHDAARRDGSELSEELAELGVVDGVLEVLDVEVGAGHLLHAFATLGVELRLELSLALRLLLRPADDPRLVLDLVVPVELLDGLLRRVGILEAHEAEALGLPLGVLHHDDGGERAVLLEHLAEHVLGDGLVQVLDVDVVERARPAAALAASLERTDVHLLVVHQHPVHLADGALRSLRGVELDETVTLALALHVRRDLRGDDVAELREGVVEGLVVDLLVEVLDEDVADAGLAKRGISLRVHDANRLAVHDLEVQDVDGARGIGPLLKVHVRVPERAARDEVAADADGHHRTDGGEQLVQLRFRRLRREVAAIKARRGEAGGGRRGRGGRGGSGGSGGSGGHVLFFFCFFWVEGSATVRGARGREGEPADEMRLFSGAAAARRSSLRALSFLGSCAADQEK